MYSKISFICNKCGASLCKEITVPDTDMSNNEGDYGIAEVVCDVCRNNFVVNVNNRGGVVIASINGIIINDTGPLYDEKGTQFEEPDWMGEYKWYIQINQKTVFQYFTSSMNNIRDLLTVSIPSKNQLEMFNRMLLVQAISSMEAYLSDTLISRVITNPRLLSKLYEKDRYLRNEKCTFTDILKDRELPEKHAGSYLSSLMYHNLPRIEFIYKSVFDIDFKYGGKDKKTDLLLAIETRHDFVHRDGKTKSDGELRLVDKKYIAKILNIIEDFIASLEEEIISYDIPF